MPGAARYRGETAYRRYLAWRTDGVRPEYRAMLDELSPHPLCRLVRVLGT